MTTQEKLKNIAYALNKTLNDLEQKKREKRKCCLCNPKSTLSFLCYECKEKGWKLGTKREILGK